MKCVNLYYLYTASKVNIKEFRSYEKILSNRSKITSLGDREKGSIYHLVDYLLANGCMFEKLNNFYYSYILFIFHKDVQKFSHFHPCPF